MVRGPPYENTCRTEDGEENLEHVLCSVGLPNLARLVELGCSLFFSTVSGFASLAVRSRKRPGVFDPGGQEGDVFAKPSELSGNWLNRRRVGSSDCRRKRRRDSVPVGARSDTGSNCCSRGDELQTLCKQGQLDRAVDLLVRMDQQGAVPSVSMYSSLLKACASKRALAQARRVHAHLSQRGLDCNRFVGEYVVSTLVRCGGLQDALQVFQRLADRTVFSWTAVILGHAMCGQGREALNWYWLMQEEGVQPNTYTFVALIKACGAIAELDEGKRIHAEAIKCGLGTDLFVRTCLVDMYGKCGSILEAQKVFEGLSHRDVVAWTAMITACAQQGQAELALHLYEQMQEDGVTPNERTFVGALQACGILAAEIPVESFGEDSRLECLARGKAVHAEAWTKGYDSNAFVGSTVVSMYGKSGSIVDAQILFDGLSERNVVSWNAILAGCAQHAPAQRTLDMYELMLEEGVSPNGLTFVTALQACGMIAGEKFDASRMKSLSYGKALHADILRTGYAADLVVGNTLVNMYGKCGSLEDAQNVFNGLPHRDVVSWNAMLSANVQQGHAGRALEQFAQMCEEGVNSDVRTFVSLLEACGILAEKEAGAVLDGQLIKVDSLNMGKVLHRDAVVKGFTSNVFVGNTLISLYGKCGSTLDAQNVFEGLPQRNMVGWTAMISTYTQHGLGERAVEMYRLMREKGVSPDDLVLVSILQACSITGSLDVCRQIHRTLASKPTRSDSLVGNTLVHAYSRCASMVEAQNVFDALLKPNVVSWTALIAGYAREGISSKSLQCYDEMQMAGVQPNKVTFLALLSACSHAGLADKGLEYFESMSKYHGIAPEIEHYVSLVDILGRVGDFTRLEHLLSTMPVKPDLAMWCCLLGACRKHGKVMLGKQVFDCAVHLEPEHSAAYVLMSNIYADAGLWDHAKELKSSRFKASAWKKPGQSWVEHQQKVHRFGIGDGKEQQLYNILQKVSSG